MNNPNVNQIVQSIHSGSFTDDQLNLIRDALRYAKTQIAKKNISQFVVGDRVSFNTKGKTIVGKVSKLGRKFVTVNENYSRSWRVPAFMLTAAAPLTIG
jgi:hypothetical protein